MGFQDKIQFKRYKARHVTKGFQQTPWVKCFETFSSIVNVATIKIILSIVDHFDQEIKKVDINNAFLNGELEES